MSNVEQLSLFINILNQFYIGSVFIF